MDIHKPKPWHGLREFLKEYVIIVVGVLTALGAEQAVEAIHTAQKAAEAENLVREEFGRNVAFAQEKVLLTPCLSEQFKLVQRVLLVTPPDRPVPKLRGLLVYRRPFTSAQWEGAVASGIAGHFLADRRLAYQRLYLVGNGGMGLNDLQVSLTDATAKLETLILAPRRIDAVTREQLLQAAAQARLYNSLVNSESQSLIRFAAPLHLPPPKLQSSVKTPEEAKSCLDNVLAQEATLPPIPTTAD